MTPLEMIAEWRRGCSCAGPEYEQMFKKPEGSSSPCECTDCTEGLITAIENSIKGGCLRPTRQLVTIQHGSHLYGTSTPTSDTDLKGVHLPSGLGIVLGRPEDVIERNVVAKEGTKNTADAVDNQSYSLAKFLGMLAKGDTVATEILFAPPWAIVDMDPLWPLIQAQAVKVLNRQAKGFVGYCQRQAAKYGVKGSRMAAVKKLVDLLDSVGGAQFVEPRGTRPTKLSDIEDRLKAFAEAEEHASWVNIPHPDGRECWHIECCDRKMPMTAGLKEAQNVYGTVWANYGERARAAMTNEGIDWKAISHAVRVARQALELLRSHTITFPRPDAAELLEIKQGKRSYQDVSPLLEALVDEVNSCSSTLPERTDPALVDELVQRYYLPQVTGAEW